MKEISQASALSRIVTEFDRRGWRKDVGVSADLVREAVQMGPAVDYDKLSKTVPSTFLGANRTTRPEVRTALERALAGAQIVPDSLAHVSAVQIFGDVFMGRNEVTKKNITINNQGQFAGNIDSSNSEVKVNNQQQALLPEQEHLLRDQMDRPEIKAVLLEPLPPEEKSVAIGSKLAKWTGYAVDVTTDFAAKFLAEMVRPM